MEYEIRSTVDTIANGGLQSSRALAEKLRELEAERDHLSRQAPAQRKIVSIVPQVANLFREKVKELPQLAKADPDRGRMLLRRLIGGSLRLLPEDGRLVANVRFMGPANGRASRHTSPRDQRHPPDDYGENQEDDCNPQSWVPDEPVDVPAGLHDDRIRMRVLGIRQSLG